ncbi:ATP-binding cassette (ABC) Superfamily [Phytophthora palmivora]|uniref:ATP-binding cassette (ABC) Superfamily n=1 Tax=Phytophthora palmivora TaxID=4796 RepID=A0A2P4YEG5_9STRA|nr:ATP-binding cassette (ABC) Superfamily [Phytophthora palmivora]
MPKKASTYGASAPPKSKTAQAKSKDKAAPRKEARKAASEATSKRTAAAAKQGGGPRRSRSRSSSPDDKPNPRFTYRDHSPGSESPVFDIPMITGSESDGDSPGFTKDPTPSQDAPVQDTPSQDTPADDAESSEAKAASTSSPAKNLTLDEGKARAQAAKAATSKRADEGAAAAKKRAAPGSPTSEPSIAKGFKSLFDSSDEDKEEGAVTEPQEISNDLDEQHERYQAAQQQGAPAPPTPVSPREYNPPDAGAPRGLNHGRTSRGTYERASVQDEPLFVSDIEAARCVLLAPHRIPLKEFTSLWNKPEDRGGPFPVWGYPWVQPENTTTQSQAEDLFWRWVSLKNFTVHELKELREDRLLSYVLDQRDLRIEFAHLVAKRQLHSVMEGLRQQSKSSTQDERGYGSVNPGTVHPSPPLTMEASVPPCKVSGTWGCRNPFK